jgi:hypothetical protein
MLLGARAATGRNNNGIEEPSPNPRGNLAGEPSFAWNLRRKGDGC